MAANSSINLVNLDFDTLKNSLKSYLKAQAQFSDYDFDGSNMSVLLDILAYNTHMNAFYLNMVASEMFLDSAQLRNSVISKAKELNYTPRSAKSSQSEITVTFPQSGLQVFQIPVATKFTGRTGNGSFTYVTNQATTIYPSNNQFTSNVVVYEGFYTSDAFVVDDSVEAQRFILTNDNIDTDSLQVQVSENGGQTNTIFIKAENLYGLNSNSAVYFLQATEDTKYELVFGDGVLGRKPLNDATVIAAYRVTRGSDADGANEFTLDDNLGPVNGLGGFVNSTITVVAASFGGANAEGIESIRYNAPRHFQTQNRAVTASDFKDLVLNNYTEVKAVNVFGGETVTNGVEYGKVFVTPVTFSGAPLASFEKQDIENFLRARCTLGITPQVIDPDYLYVLVQTRVKFRQNDTSNTPADIKNIVSNAIQVYDENELTEFDIEFKLSRLDEAINDADVSISSNETSVVMRKDVNPELNTPVYIDVNYRNSIVPGSLSSTTFTSAGKTYQYTDFNQLNNTLAVRQLAGGKIQVTNSSNAIYLKDVSLPGYESYTVAGTIDYTNGVLALNQIEINSFVDSSSIRFFAAPQTQDIRATGNDLIQIDLQNLDITVVAV
ncbi:baseplate wedge subunit [uncultured Caudovirales phage]|uniref:Baseplate wedge subunit n=1 Tax=uncultured Caudovirales phage TaxID=2100421 RepID=A0A6J5M210_9CAUD|nr:baseplate wedge subunit [uncultured Caudovirales phage]